MLFAQWWNRRKNKQQLEKPEGSYPDSSKSTEKTKKQKLQKTEYPTICNGKYKGLANMYATKLLLDLFYKALAPRSAIKHTRNSIF